MQPPRRNGRDRLLTNRRGFGPAPTGRHDMRQYADDIIAGFILLLLTLGWIDWLWVFGIENSRSYTWWALIVHIGN